jgi:aldehyde dehydrogenase (NAD+)
MMTGQKKNLINGVWVGGDDLTENLNPSDRRDIIGYFARANASLVDEAIAAANAVGHAWGAASPQVRSDLLVGTSIFGSAANF